jgi:outer membrane protein assembly factor BamA
VTRFYFLKNAIAILILLFLSMVPSSAVFADRPPAIIRNAQTLPEGEAQQEDLNSEDLPEVAESSADKKGVDFIVAPIPFANPSLGFGVTAVAGVIYPLDKNDPRTPPSMTGLMGFYTENKSWSGGIFQRLYLPGDKWRFLAGLIHANINYNYFGVGTDAGREGDSVPITQRINGLTGDALYRLYQSLFVGVVASWVKTDATINSSDFSSVVPPEKLTSETVALGPKLTLDTRDSTFNPKRGIFSEGSYKYFGPELGSDFKYDVTDVSYNQYFPMSERHVLAVRGYGRFATGDVPFYALSQFGMKGDLRGYTGGRYRDKMLLATQAESRWQITKRFGMVGFVGVGEVAPTISSFNTDDLLPSAGGGIRYMLSEMNKINYRIDFALGSGESGLYFSVGEAF